MSRQSGLSPSLFLMPLAFGSLLGGCLTLIGTPPNIIIASYRAQTGDAPFGMFDFLPVGAAITIASVLFILLFGRKLTPRRQSADASDGLFEISSYLTELTVPQESNFKDQSLYKVLSSMDEEADIQIVALIRDKQQQNAPAMYELLREGDVLLVDADSDSLKSFMDVTRFVLTSKAEAEADAEESPKQENQNKPAEVDVTEAIVAHDSVLVGQTSTNLSIRERYGINILAVARRGHRLTDRLHKIRFAAGDILLMQGDEDALKTAMQQLNCLPLASRGLQIGQPRRILGASLIFASVIALIMFNLVSTATAMVAGVLAMFLAGLLPKDKLYKGIDLPVIVLLAAMLPVGQALETTGGSTLIANALLNLTQTMPPAGALAILMVATMLLSNVINNAAAGILVAPIAVSLANGMNVSADPLLMSVVIGAACAFLTPIAHQSNTLVMEPGGYKFTDYWRLGLPLSMIVVVVAVPMILWVWPL